MRLCALLVLACLPAVGCASADEGAEQMPSCVELSASCDPLYAPVFDELFARTLKPTCAQGGGSCHGPDGQQGGLVLADADAAHSLLATRLVPGDAACSELVVRTHQAGRPWSMPPGSSLSEQERCVIRRWIELGAAR